MFQGASGNNIFIKKLNINAKTHQISIKCAKNKILRNMLFTSIIHCVPSYFFVKKVKILNF